MPQAKTGDTVRLHYVGSLPDGDVFDSSTGREPLEFVLGAGSVIAGFDDGVLGMSPGESKTVEIPADRAYGPRYEERVFDVEKARLPHDLQVEVGQQLRMGQPDGRSVTVTVTSVTPNSITLDGNHPLAGKDLVFEVQLVEIV
jgi:peptidylprolyl isomerase